MMLDLKNKKVTVIGGKRSGVAAAKLVARLNGRPKISDSGPADLMVKELSQFLGRNDIPIEIGGHSQAFVEDSDLLVLSPGVRYDALPVQWARARDIPVLGEIEFAWRLCVKPVIAVTGSNGKTTVVTLIAEVLRKAGKRVCLCGNVGSAFSQHVLDLKDTDYVVLEISSFQLESIIDFRPHIAVFINFSQNHLDRHKNLEEYLEAKKRIFLNQRPSDYAVLNDADPIVKSLAADLKAKVCYFNSFEQREESGIDNPNFLAAMEVGRIIGVSPHVCRKVFDEFRGVEHRRELVQTLNRVEYVNDSKSTTAEATRWALERATKPLILICGGRDKHIDFSVLRELVKEKVKKMLVIGEAKEKIKKTFADVVNVEEWESLPAALERAKKIAQPGDCVILSPMCASFDMFNDYEHRGKVFKEIVEKF